MMLHILQTSRAGHKPALLCAFLLLYFCTSAAAIATTETRMGSPDFSDLELNWHVERDKQQLRLQPELRSPHDLDLRYELLSLDNPAQKIRQAGNTRLQANMPRTLGRLVFSAPASGSCRLRLTLWLGEQTREYEINPCATPAK